MWYKGGRRGKNERESERESKRERIPNVSRTTRTVVLIFTFYIMTSSLKTLTHVIKNFHYRDVNLNTQHKTTTTIYQTTLIPQPKFNGCFRIVQTNSLVPYCTVMRTFNDPFVHDIQTDRSKQQSWSTNAQLNTRTTKKKVAQQKKSPSVQQ